MRTGRPTSGLAVIAVLVLVALAAMADTFTNKKTGEKIEGSLLTKSRLGSNEQLVVRTDNGGVRNLPAAEWDVVEEAKNTVCFLQIEVPLETEGARDEILKDIKRAAARRADIVVVELDTPGGVVEYAKQICLSLEAQKFRRVVAYVRAGENQGAFSAGALIAMACDEIYIAEGASIGAAAPFVMTEEGPEFTEKMTSAFSANFRSLAEKHNRPKALAAAMVDPDVELREVTVDGKREFVSGERAEELGRTGATIGKWIIRKGKLLTLTAVEARDLGIADAVANSREELLKALGWPRARVVDLQTTRWVAAWLEYARVFRGLAASFASARGADPASSSMTSLREWSAQL